LNGSATASENPVRLFRHLLLACVASVVGHAANAAPSPDVVFIAIDDLRPWVGAMGFAAAKTPNMDRLATRAVTFTNAYATSPWCLPSRTALLTGLRPSTTGVYTHYDSGWRKSPVLRERATLPQYFRNHGYAVVGAGKIFHHATEDQDPRSWDRYWPSQTQCMLLHGAANPPLNGLNLRPTVDWGPSWKEKREMPDWKVADFIVEELRKPQERPLFLACGFYLPHLPWYVPQEYLDRYPLADVPLPPLLESDLDDIGAYGKRFALGEGMMDPDDPHDYGSGKGIFEKIRTAGQWRLAVQAYLASISFADDCLGRVLDAIENRPDGRSTIVCLWSDNGWHLGEKHHWEKVSLWEEATRIVLMVSAPGLRQGVSSQRVVNLMDLHPTLIELCGLPPRTDLECRSLVPLLRNPGAEWDYPTLMTHGRGNHAVRTERYRYIRYRNGEEELYDHANDPNEWTNLAGTLGAAVVIDQLRPNFPRTEAAPIVKEFSWKKR